MVNKPASNSGSWRLALCISHVERSLRSNGNQRSRAQISSSSDVSSSSEAHMVNKVRISKCVIILKHLEKRESKYRGKTQCSKRQERQRNNKHGNWSNNASEFLGIGMSFKTLSKAITARFFSLPTCEEECFLQQRILIIVGTYPIECATSARIWIFRLYEILYEQR